MKVKAYLAAKRYASGMAPVLLEITTPTGKRYTKKILAIDPKLWTGSTISTDTKKGRSLNRILENELEKAREAVYKAQATGQDFNPALYFAGGDTLAGVLRARYLELEKAGQYRTAAKYRQVADKVSDYDNRQTVTLSRSWLEKFDTHLKNQGQKTNTRAKYLKTVLAAARYAGAELSGIKGFTISTEKVIKEKLTRAELDAFKTIELGRTADRARAFWLFSFYTWGARTADLLAAGPGNIKSGYFEYKAMKTGKAYTIQLPPPALEILKDYALVGPYLFYPIKGKPHSKRWLSSIVSRTAALNKQLKKVAAAAGIPKRVTMHTARHTFAVMAEDAGVTLSDIKEMLAHSDIKTTAIYLEQLKASDKLNAAASKLYL